MLIGGIEMNPGPNQVSVTYTQVNITIMLIPWFQLLVLVALLLIGGIELNPGKNHVSVTYTQVNITILFIPMVPAAGAGGALGHRRD